MNSDIRIYFVLMMVLIGEAKEWIPEVYAEGTNATIKMNEINLNGTQVLEINFSGFFSKPNISNVMLYDPVKMQLALLSVHDYYNGRIRNFVMNKDCLSFLLLHVTFMDSGTYTVFENGMEKGNTILLVPRPVLLRQDIGSAILPFMCNKPNISTITVEMISPIPHFVVMFDVKQKQCTDFSNLHTNRIGICAVNESKFTFNFQQISWLDKGTYVAWDEKRFLLDSIFLDFREIATFSSLKSSKLDITAPLTPTETSYVSTHERRHDLVTTHTQADNANASIDDDYTDLNRSVHIELSGFKTNLYITNVILRSLQNDQCDGEFVRRNYTGQIQIIEIDKDSLSFQLLNGTFESITESETSCGNRNASIKVVKRNILVPIDEETRIPPSVCGRMETYATDCSIINNVRRGNCTCVVHNYAARIKTMSISLNKVSFIFQELPWFNISIFNACDDNDFILHSVFINFQGSSLEITDTLSVSTAYTDGSANSTENSLWILFSAIIVLLVATCLAVVVLRKLQGSRANAVASSEVNDFTFRNRSKPTASQASGALSAMNLNIEYQTCNKNNNDQAISRSQRANIISTETSVEGNDEPCTEYDYVVQHSFMTLRPPAPAPVAIRNSEKVVAIVESMNLYERLETKESSTVHLPTVNVYDDKRRAKDSNCNAIVSEAGNHTFINNLAPSDDFDVDSIHATNVLTSSFCGDKHGGQAEILNSKALATKPENVELPENYNNLSTRATL